VASTSAQCQLSEANPPAPEHSLSPNLRSYPLLILFLQQRHIDVAAISVVLFLSKMPTAPSRMHFWTFPVFWTFPSPSSNVWQSLLRAITATTFVLTTTDQKMIGSPWETQAATKGVDEAATRMTARIKMVRREEQQKRREILL
jgi:hypothetical protein